MFRQLQPVSDLQRAQGFDDFDLAANRKGSLSTRQRWRLFGKRLLEHALGTLSIVFVFALLIDRLRLAPSLDQIGLVFGVTAVVMLLLFIIHIRRTLLSDIKTTSGQIAKYQAAPLAGLSLEEVTVEQAKFYLRPDVYDLLDEDTRYRLYYLERNPSAGGNLLLSMEAQSRAPGDASPQKLGSDNLSI